MQVSENLGAADRVRTADLLGAFSVATDLAAGLPAEHALRSCYIGMRIADELGLSPTERAHLYYAELLMDVGCTAWTSPAAASMMSDELYARRKVFFEAESTGPASSLGWLLSSVAADAPLASRAGRVLRFAIQGPSFMQEGFKNTCEVAQRFATRMGMPPEVQQALASVFEQWDGSGPYGRHGHSIPLTSRIVYASIFLEVFHRLGGREAAIRVARRRKGKAFDPSVVDAFVAASDDAEFCAVLDSATVWDTVLSLEPDSAYCFIPHDRMPEVVLSFADFADLKSPYFTGHSRRVAELSAQIARRMGLADREVEVIHTAGLVHDLGLVAVPSFTLDKPPDKLSNAEQESMRLHPYHGERILSRMPAMKEAARLVAAHHERATGQGYYRGLTGPEIPIGARIIGTVDLFDELTHDGPGHTGFGRDAALERLKVEVDRGLDAGVVRALGEEVGSSIELATSARPAIRDWPGGLTEREVQVLRQLAKGRNRREIAKDLVVSEGTIRSHLEHIYAKIGVSTQIAAVLFALEHELVD